MFDVFPVDKSGSLDWEKIHKIGESGTVHVLQTEKDTREAVLDSEFARMREAIVSRQEKRVEIPPAIAEDTPFELLSAQETFFTTDNSDTQQEYDNNEDMRIAWEQLGREGTAQKTVLQTLGEPEWTNDAQSLPPAFPPKRFFEATRKLLDFEKRKMAISFASCGLVLTVSILTISYVGRGIGVKGDVIDASQDGYAELQSALKSVMGKNLQASAEDFNEAYEKFSKASNDLDQMGSVIIQASRFIPMASKLSSGKNAVEAGKHFAAAGKALNEVAKEALLIKNPVAGNDVQQLSLLDSFKRSEEGIGMAQGELEAAKSNIDRINIDDLPEEKHAQFLDLKEKLPMMLSFMRTITNNSSIFTDILGGNSPRKYLFLFQNNAEMRATGGFIGTYGLLDISQGRIRKFFIDGIFNPDGQLKDNVVPPVPIQKISGAWSLHDSNWFPDFPVSAKEAINFYERTGGPTVDGIITMTPTVIQKLLAVTGPIEMPDYGATLTSDNFIEVTQYEVEVDYDKSENKPKKILSDLAPILLDKVLGTTDPKMLSRALAVMSDGLREKHILLYSSNKDLENIISQQGWSGEMLSATKDYLSIINTNINGYKTDSVVNESISHNAVIQDDGSVVDTVSITRKHNGGGANYEWWNKVNADYMRVYVPLGSELISVSGQTREQVNSPLDYDALGFERDSLVQQEEDSVTVDSKSGTRVYADAGKTVFGNWVYVSPGESVTITYTYLLPFKLFPVTRNGDSQADSYSLVAQKQSGSIGSEFAFNLRYPKSYLEKWHSLENGIDGNSDTQTLSYRLKLDTDKYIGVAFEK